MMATTARISSTMKETDRHSSVRITSARCRPMPPAPTMQRMVEERVLLSNRHNEELEPVRREPEVLVLHHGQLGAAQRRGVAEQQQGAVAQAGQVAPARGDELPDLGGGERRGPALGRAVAAPDPAQGLADGGVAGIKAVAGRAVGAGERRRCVARR